MRVGLEPIGKLFDIEKRRARTASSIADKHRFRHRRSTPSAERTISSVAVTPRVDSDESETRDLQKEMNMDEQDRQDLECRIKIHGVTRTSYRL